MNSGRCALQAGALPAALWSKAPCPGTFSLSRAMVLIIDSVPGDVRQSTSHHDFHSINIFQNDMRTNVRNKTKLLSFLTDRNSGCSRE